jgi:hypothetical protein
VTLEREWPVAEMNRYEVIVLGMDLVDFFPGIPGATTHLWCREWWLDCEAEYDCLVSPEDNRALESSEPVLLRLSLGNMNQHTRLKSYLRYWDPALKVQIHH